MSYRDQAAEVASHGRYGDSMLIHVNPDEVDWLSRQVPLTVNPDTGYPEAFLPFLLGMGLPLLAGSGTAAGTALAGLGLSAPMLSGIGSGIGSLIETGDPGQALLSGGLGYAGSSLFNGLGGEAGAAAGEGASQSAQGIASGYAGPESLAATAPAGIQSLGPLSAPAAEAAKAASSSGGFMGMVKDNIVPIGLGVGALGMLSTPSMPGEEEENGEGPPRRKAIRQQYAPPITGFENTYFGPMSYVPRGYAEGGITALGGAAAQGEPPGVMTREKAVAEEAALAVRGLHPDPKNAIKRFVEIFGMDALQQLANQVIAEDSGGVSEEGVPLARKDDQTAMVDGKEPVGLQTGEYVIPADEVAGMDPAGRNSLNRGAQQIDAMRGVA